MIPSSTARQFLRTLTLVALAISALFTVDTFLAKTEESESRIEAARLFAEGQRLLDQDRNSEAADRLGDALAIERQNRDYQLALAQAQLGSGQLTDAEATLNSLLVADSTDGPANLNMARVLAKEGKIREAISYYHRAVYGSWASDAAGNRSMARFELIELLAQQNSKEELLAELLAVEDQAPADAAMRLRIAGLFLAAGSPARAAAEYQQVLKNEPSNTAAYAGLAESEFAQGDYRAAIADFSSAVRLNPSDQASAKRLELCNRVFALDPTRRGLDAAERFRRSRVVLKMTVDSVAACSGAAARADVDESLDEARKSLKERANPVHQDAVAEANLDLAERLWPARTRKCAASPDDPLALVLAKAAR